MATVQTLKDKDNNTFYPVTKTEAVYNGDGSKTLDYILDNTIIASEDPADANKVFKGNASLGLVGPSNIDWSAFPQAELSNMESYLSENWSLLATDRNFIMKYGNLVFVCLPVKYSGTLTAGADSYPVAMTLPSGWRPTKTTNFGATYVYNHVLANAYIRTNGEIVIRPSATASNPEFTINAIYRLD